MDVLIFGGQSNMQGQTESLPEEAPVGGAFEYLYETDAFRPLAHPVGENFGELLLAAHEGHGSLVSSFCRAYREACGEEVAAIHAAKGATTIADWHPNGERYAFALKKICAGISAAKRLGEMRKIYYIWLQGESDAIEGRSEEEYLRALVEYKNALMRDTGIQKFGMIRVGYFVNDERDLAIMRAQERAVREDKDFVMLTRLTEEFSRDAQFLNPFAPGHYNNRAMELLGRDAGQTLGKLRSEP